MALLPPKICLPFVKNAAWWPPGPFVGMHINVKFYKCLVEIYCTTGWVSKNESMYIVRYVPLKH